MKQHIFHQQAGGGQKNDKISEQYSLVDVTYLQCYDDVWRKEKHLADTNNAIYSKGSHWKQADEKLIGKKANPVLQEN